MTKSPKRKVAFISSYLPVKCGIATFCSDLIKNIGLACGDNFEPLVVAMRGDNETRYGEPVKFEIRKNVKNDYICAADYINFSHVDLVSVQHEFGLFGGVAGSYLTLLLERLKSPVITTVHTVLNEPDNEHQKSMVDVCRASDQVITMNERGVGMLENNYGVDADKIKLIPHGIPDLPFVDNNYYKHKFNMEGRKIILTFGLLSKNKGIEVILKALPAIVKANPSVLYVILGMTHPSVISYEGESYRFKLQRMVNELGLQKHVIFHNRFVNDEELHNFLCAADIYVTPYLNREQLTSGTLSFAVGAGKAVVSTPYWAAMELLAEGRGKLVRFGDYKQLANAINEILADERLFYNLRRNAYDYGRSRTWPKIGEIYSKLFYSEQILVKMDQKTRQVAPRPVPKTEIPEPSLEHLVRLTDDTGLFQHAKYTLPDRRYGYCTDDNARAVILLNKYYQQYPEKQALKLFDLYLSFVLDSQDEDGLIRNFMHFNRSWMANEPAHDAFGRSLWAFGNVIANPPLMAYLSIIKDCFDRSVPLIEKQSMRGKAYCILGLADYLEQFPGASDIKRHLAMAAEDIVSMYEANNKSDWCWFEDILAYENAVLPHSLFVAGLVVDDKYLKVAKKTCEFLLDNTFDGNHFSFIGCNGWYRHGREKAKFDQQALEAVSTVLMLRAAYNATGDIEYLKIQQKAFNWFLGENDLGIPVYDFKTKGCHDGLMASGVNLNQGAESTLSFLISLLEITETISVIDKEFTEISPDSVPHQNDTSSDRVIQEIADQPGMKKDGIGEFK